MQQISGLQNFAYDIYIKPNQWYLISQLIRVGCH